MMMSFFIFSVELMVTSDISINVVIRKYDGNKIVREQTPNANLFICAIRLTYIQSQC